MAAGTHDSDEVISGINVTPLVDIVLVILIIFIVTASFVLKTRIPVELPRAATGEAGEAGLMNLALTAQGELFLDSQPLSLDALPAAVREARERARSEGRTVSAFIAADVATPYGKFAALVDRLRAEEVTDIALDTQPVALEEAGR
jgi:biopolymer transport protein ExbD